MDKALHHEFSQLMVNRWQGNTTRGYLYGWNKLVAFLDSHTEQGIRRGSLWTPLAEPSRQGAWLAFLLWMRIQKPVGAGLAYETARKIFVGINAVVVSSGHPRIPFNSFFILVEARKSWKQYVVPSSHKTNITEENLTFLLSFADQYPLEVAISVFAFYTLARLGEAFATVWQATYRHPTFTRSFLNRSKADHDRRGVNLYVPPAIWDIILTLNPPPASHTGPLFPMSISAFRKWLKMVLPRATGHSFRRGGAQHLFDSGLPLDLIRRKGRWASSAWRVYIATTARDSGIFAAKHVQGFPLVEHSFYDN
jgi:hypothetical protein